MADTRFNKDDLNAYLYLFELAVYAQDEQPFRSFEESRYLSKSENFKHKCYQSAHNDCLAVKQTDIGTGKILEEIGRKLSDAVPLVDYRDVSKFVEAKGKDKTAIERALYDLYNHADAEKGYEELRSLGCGNYAILSLLAFFRSEKHFLPVHSKKMQERFATLGYKVVLAGHSDWHSYLEDYIDAMWEVRYALIDYFHVTENEVSLLDAHSFVWLMPTYKEKAQKIMHEFVPDLEKLTEKEAVVHVRIGQTRYRNELIKKWHGKCSVTGCSNEHVLIASHIKPWKDCGLGSDERMDPDNGLLLIPNLDNLFDQGLISFNNDGSLIVSSKVSAEDARILGINTEHTTLTSISGRTADYLAYHRENVFKR